MPDFYDVIIVGAGVAGLSALLATDQKQRVALVNPGSPLHTGSTWRAQGGVAVALGADDSPNLHAQDTMAASRYMASAQAVKTLTEEGQTRVRELLESGLAVDRAASGETLFGLEAAHCRARVIHDKDHTGKALIAHLWHLAKARPNTSFIDARVTRVSTNSAGVGGVTLSDGSSLSTPRVILASGGFAGLYEASTTGLEVRGEGIVLAAQVGAQVKDLEFVQFHPTALDIATSGPLPLLTEALRGGGALLRLETGERFVEELLGRDELARAIAKERSLGHRVYLDLSPVEELERCFPGAFGYLHNSPEAKHGMLPVRPAAHYTIGGVVTDLDGCSSVAGLYACGEVASVGIHGANRLASNSLLEGLVFGHRAGRHAATSLRPWSKPESLPELPRLEEATALGEFRRRFEEAVGVVRSREGLEVFSHWLQHQSVSIETELATMVCAAALKRDTNIGAHFRSDGVQPEELRHAIK